MRFALQKMIEAIDLVKLQYARRFASQKIKKAIRLAKDKSGDSPCQELASC